MHSYIKEQGKTKRKYITVLSQHTLDGLSVPIDNPSLTTL